MKKIQILSKKLGLFKILAIVTLVLLAAAVFIDYNIYYSSQSGSFGQVDSKKVLKLDKTNFDLVVSGQNTDITIHQNGNIGRTDPFLDTQ